ncbi:hypothetical protein M758_4G038100 [Ceratodon purpureus]|nr:hypothetical protein M758_4G038100 [Ceratodon purpureus]
MQRMPREETSAPLYRARQFQPTSVRQNQTHIPACLSSHDRGPASCEPTTPHSLTLPVCCYPRRTQMRVHAECDDRQCVPASRPGHRPTYVSSHPRKLTLGPAHHTRSASGNSDHTTPLRVSPHAAHVTPRMPCAPLPLQILPSGPGLPSMRQRASREIPANGTNASTAWRETLSKRHHPLHLAHAPLPIPPSRQTPTLRPPPPPSLIPPPAQSAPRALPARPPPSAWDTNARDLRWPKRETYGHARPDVQQSTAQHSTADRSRAEQSRADKLKSRGAEKRRSQERTGGGSASAWREPAWWWWWCRCWGSTTTAWSMIAIATDFPSLPLPSFPSLPNATSVSCWALATLLSLPCPALPSCLPACLPAPSLPAPLTVVPLLALTVVPLLALTVVPLLALTVVTAPRSRVPPRVPYHTAQCQARCLIPGPFLARTRSLHRAAHSPGLRSCTLVDSTPYAAVSPIRPFSPSLPVNSHFHCVGLPVKAKQNPIHVELVCRKLSPLANRVCPIFMVSCGNPLEVSKCFIL